METRELPLCPNCLKTDKAYITQFGYVCTRCNIGYSHAFDKQPNNKTMKIQVEIPADIVGYIKSLELEELDDDKIIDLIIEEAHYDKCVAWGLINCVINV